ncbi:hypothetical protein NXC12_PB00105 (plasmid) [Rhizobium etli]|uniref:Transposase IS30-like HTH domain-containing protein n=1 Tax=Rhizobium etli TaxID=29449 RepID=A0AAN1EM18_RHIET|nr:hypothetical protein NXC12_PB00105 [Rhizobium etli]
MSVALLRADTQSLALNAPGSHWRLSDRATGDTGMARSFVQLSLDERRVIAQMHAKKISQAEIARTLSRDRSNYPGTPAYGPFHKDDEALCCHRRSTERIP